MSADISGSIKAHPDSVNGARRPWLFALGGAVLGGCAVAAVAIGAGSAFSFSLQHASLGDRPSSLAFGLTPASARPRMLSGIGGETLADSVAGVAHAGQVPMPDTEILSPTAWDRLSAGDCISLTTASGKKLSFRIMGARNAEARDADSSQNIDLAVSACAPGSDAVLKAVIEPKDEGKQSAVQRNL